MKIDIKKNNPLDFLGEMSGLRGNGSVSTLPLPRPKSPPKYPDLYGKRQELAKIQILEREIGFLEVIFFKDLYVQIALFLSLPWPI